MTKPINASELESKTETLPPLSDEVIEVFNDFIKKEWEVCYKNQSVITEWQLREELNKRKLNYTQKQIIELYSVEGWNVVFRCIEPERWSENDSYTLIYFKKQSF